MDKNINYEELNKYDFYIKYFLHLAIGTKYEEKVEITENEYERLSLFINNSEKAMIKLEKAYCVGFYIESKTYVIQEVSKDVYICLKQSQQYERNKIRHEKERHLDTYFEQDNIETIPANDNTEDKALNYVEDLELKLFLDKLLSNKQSKRFYQNIIEEKTYKNIAQKEGLTPGAIRDSVDQAKQIIKNYYKKFKKFN